MNKAGEQFKHAMFIYMSNFMNNKLVPDTYDYTKLFGLWKGKGSKLDLKNDTLHTRERMGRKILGGTSFRKNESTHNKALPKNANRGNERKFKLRTPNSS